MKSQISDTRGTPRLLHRDLCIGRLICCSPAHATADHAISTTLETKNIWALVAEAPKIIEDLDDQ